MQILKVYWMQIEEIACADSGKDIASRAAELCGKTLLNTRQERFMLRESRLTTGICSSKIEIMGFCQKTRKEANHPMKHQLLALLLGSLLLLGLPAACADTPTITVLMYMCGTDLQSDCVNDLYEMCAADIPDNVTVVVQAGGASQWDDSRLRANHINRFTIADYDFSDVEVCAWQSMGAQNTLEDYLTWATSTYPADRYMLIFWNHGADRRAASASTKQRITMG